MVTCDGTDDAWDFPIEALGEFCVKSKITSEITACSIVKLTNTAKLCCIFRHILLVPTCCQTPLSTGKNCAYVCILLYFKRCSHDIAVPHLDHCFVTSCLDCMLLARLSCFCLFLLMGRCSRCDGTLLSPKWRKTLVDLHWSICLKAGNQV